MILLRRKGDPPRIVYPQRIFCRKHSEIKTSSDRGKLREFIKGRPKLQELLKGKFSTKGK